MIDTLLLLSSNGMLSPSPSPSSLSLSLSLSLWLCLTACLPHPPSLPLSLLLSYAIYALLESYAEDDLIFRCLFYRDMEKKRPMPPISSSLDSKATITDTDSQMFSFSVESADR